VTKGYAAPEVEQAFTRARELCQRVGETSQLLEVLVGLRVFYQVRGDPRTARELGEQAVTLAERIHDPMLVARAHFGLGHTLFCLGAFGQAREQLEQGIARYILGGDVSPRQRSQAWQDPGAFCMVTVAWVLWYLGYPDQALACSREGLSLAQQLSNRPAREQALSSAAILHQLRREVSVA
jgi:tetratricopeptide (TPR) repeat protein